MKVRYSTNSEKVMEYILIHMVIYIVENERMTDLRESINLNFCIISRGFYLFLNGERYEGRLANGVKDGNGVYYYTNGNKYEGGWKNDLKHGHGIYCNFTNGEKYEG